MLARILITTKTYPSISKKYVETVCTAGVLLNQQNEPIRWVRLYPINFRYLDFDQQFKKYSIIEVEIERNTSDPRLESYRINEKTLKTIEQVDTSKGTWIRRKALALPLLRNTIADIKERGESIGIIKPFQIKKCYSAPSGKDWKDSQQVVLGQQDLFVQKRDLEKIPFNFKYEFTCLVNGREKTHRLSVIDWEIMELYRKEKNRYLGTEEEKQAFGVNQVMKQFERFLQKKELYFIVGNQQRFPDSFLIISLFYPPLSPPVEGRQLPLFDV